MELIDELCEKLKSIDFNVCDEDYFNELLDNRDKDPFDSEWCRVYKEINALKNTQKYTVENEEEQSRVREKAFMIVEEIADSELSEYVSDDFGLIYDSIVLNYNDEWLNKLIALYRNGIIPTGDLE